MEIEHLILIPVVYNTYFFKKVNIEHYSIQPTIYTHNYAHSHVHVHTFVFMADTERNCAFFDVDKTNFRQTDRHISAILAFLIWR